MSHITIPGQRRPSARCIAFVKTKEQCRLKAYLPTKDDVPTIGWGATGRDIKLGMVWTQAQADARFAQDIGYFAKGVDKLLGDAPTTQGMFDALTSFAYNVGLDDDADTKAEGLGDSSLLRRHKAGDFVTAAAKFNDWVYQKGKRLRGLVIRRAEEAAMYLDGSVPVA